MTVDAVASMREGAVSLVPPDARTVGALDIADLPPASKRWLAVSITGADCVYFAIEVDGRHVGQMFLHDVDRPAREAMVGYHVFEERDRRRGYASEALRLLADFAATELALRRLVAITGIENIASQRTAAAAGFVLEGAAREGPHLVVSARVLASSKDATAVGAA